MQVNVLPLFSSHYSIGNSILTLETPSIADKNRPISIFDILSEYGLKDLFLVEKNMSGFLKALKTCQSNKLDLHFGLRLICCEDITQKSTESLESEHKIIIFARNDEGYKILSKIYSVAATDGFYYQPRIDSPTLERLWSNDHLTLCHPFYDSFLHRNALYFARCNPNFSFIKPQFFFTEDNDLPFNFLITEAVSNFLAHNEGKTVAAKTVYYSKKSDFKNYIAYRAIHNRKSLNSPSEDHLSCNSFCAESWMSENSLKS